MKRLLKIIAIGLASVIVVLLVYGVLIEPRLILDERRYETRVPGLGEPWRGREVAVFSDLQVGMWFDNTGMVERVVDRIVAADPAAVLLGGDFLYSTDPSVSVQIETILELLAPLSETGIPMFAVLGNHDYEVGAADELTRALEEEGIQVLLNEAAPIRPVDAELAASVYVVGLGPARPGLTDVDEALREVPDGAARMVLMHNPTSFRELPAGSAPIAVAGHTHCGQVAVPGTPDWSYLGLTAEEALIADGFAPEGYGAPGNRLFVTCGIGFSVVPVRVNAPPQLVFFELVPG